MVRKTIQVLISLLILYKGSELKEVAIVYTGEYLLTPDVTHDSHYFSVKWILNFRCLSILNGYHF